MTAPALDYGSGGRIGVLLPSVNQAAEPQLRAMLPADIAIAVTRLKLVDSSEASLLGMARDVEPAAELLADAGVDIDLCGHTHDGQMFPGNLTIKLMWENACGYLQKGKMHNIVTSGVGLFGPNMRVGTKAEICPITIHFAKN